MTSRFDGSKPDFSVEDQHLGDENSIPDSFELLSAYIDGELSPAEKEQVQTWLDCDPEFKQLYLQLLALQGQIQNFVVPKSEKSTVEITAGVFQSIDRHRRRRRKLIWGGSAIAASLIATISGIVPGFSPLSMRIAEVNSPQGVSRSVMLAVAVDQPAINIPKSVTGYSQDNSDNLNLNQN